MSIDLNLGNLAEAFPSDLSADQKAKAQTLFLKRLSIDAHAYYGGKMQTLPKCGLWGFNWFNVWYTPGVSSVSTTIRDDNERSFNLSNRGNLVAIVSDSTRVLGDGDCTLPGGLGVMEGKAFLMKYLGGLDATALCIDSRGPDGEPDPQKIIDFVKMVQPSFGAVNLEDISQPNCFKVLDELREACDIPVWHDDAQGTATVTLAGLINALKLAGKSLSDARIVLLGAGAANTTIARLLIADGADPAKISLFDSAGGLHALRADLESDPGAYRQWELALATNPSRFDGSCAGSCSGVRRPRRLAQHRTRHGQAGVGAFHGAKGNSLCLRKPGAGDLATRGKGGGSLHSRDGPGRLSKSGEQLHLLPWPPQGCPPGASAQDHRWHGHTLCPFNSPVL
ncbi:hypothetical protein MASR2M48_20160 [Spirochaetota bacterium]